MAMKIKLSHDLGDIYLLYHAGNQKGVATPTDAATLNYANRYT
jgi:hypothetical protein